MVKLTPHSEVPAMTGSGVIAADSTVGAKAGVPANHESAIFVGGLQSILMVVSESPVDTSGPGHTSIFPCILPRLDVLTIQS